MQDPFLGEIRIVGFNFPPKGWAVCEGQILPLQQNAALFALLGTMYGGDGMRTFGLPDYRGRIPVFYGQGKGLTDYVEGETGGVETVTLTKEEIPAHTHNVMAVADPGDTNIISGNSIARSSGGAIYSGGNANVNFNQGAIGLTGNNMPHANLQPFLSLNFIIAMQGVFPRRP
jgi:microcystin-dependent protein